MSRAQEILDRALAAEEENEALREQVDRLQQRLGAAIGMEPTMAVQALAYIGRCKAAEELVRAAIHIYENDSDASAKVAWHRRATAQLKAADISARDLGEPGETDEWPLTFTTSTVESMRQIFPGRHAKRRQGTGT